MKLRRRPLVLAALALAASRESAAQDRVVRIGLLRAPPQQPRDFASFTAGLAELGHVVGRNLEIVARYGDGDVRRMPALAREIAALSPVVVVVDGEPSALAMSEAAPKLPIIFTLVGDPVAQGYARSLSHPGGNMTGLTNIALELTGKRLSLLLEAVPTIRRIAILIQPRPGVPILRDEIIAAAAQLGLVATIFEASVPSDIDPVFDRLAATAPDAIVTINAPLFYGERQHIVARANALGRPQIYPEREFVEAGGFMSYGVDFDVLWRRAASYVDRILKGAKPGDLPIEQPVKLLLSLNGRTASGLGIELPPAILLRADEIIE